MALEEQRESTIRITKSKVTNDTRGRLGKRILKAGLPLKVYTVPETAGYGCLSVNIANFGNTDAVIVLWISDAEQPSNIDIIEPAIVLKPGAVYLLYGVMISFGEKVFAAADTDSVVIRVDGTEDRIV